MEAPPLRYRPPSQNMRLMDPLEYIEQLEDALERLKPIFKKAVYGEEELTPEDKVNLNFNTGLAIGSLCAIRDSLGD